MKYLLLILLVATLVAALYRFGPRARVNREARPPDLPAFDTVTALRDWLRAEESGYSDIVPGSEADVLFARPEKPERTPLVILYLHGFSASRRETAPLAERLAADLNANLLYARLPGHGRGSAAMGEFEAADWLDAGLEAWALSSRLGERVLLIGNSQGGTLATWLAARPETREALGGIVLLSPNYRPRNPQAQWLLWPWSRQWMPLFFGKTYSFEPVNDEHRRYWTEDYPVDALFEMMALVHFVETRADPARIVAPALLGVCDDDRVVDPARARTFFGRFGSGVKEIVEVTDPGDPAHHVLAGDILSPAGTETLLPRLLEFVRKHVAEADAAGADS